MTKKISLNDWTSIDAYNPAAKWLRPLCTYTLTKIDNNFRRDCYIGWPLYLLLFLPVHLLQLFVDIWDGGLKEFEIEGRHIGQNYIIDHGDNCKRYAMAKEIWEKT